MHIVRGGVRSLFILTDIHRWIRADVVSVAMLLGGMGGIRMRSIPGELESALTDGSGSAVRMERVSLENLHLGIRVVLVIKHQ